MAKANKPVSRKNADKAPSTPEAEDKRDTGATDGAATSGSDSAADSKKGDAASPDSKTASFDAKPDPTAPKSGAASEDISEVTRDKATPAAGGKTPVQDSKASATKDESVKTSGETKDGETKGGDSKSAASGAATTSSASKAGAGKGKSGAAKTGTSKTVTTKSDTGKSDKDGKATDSAPVGKSAAGGAASAASSAATSKSDTKAGSTEAAGKTETTPPPSAAAAETGSKTTTSESGGKTTDTKSITSTTPPATRDDKRPSGGGFWALVLGGVIAAGIGFAASEFDLLGLRGANDDLRQQLRSQAADIEALQNAEAPKVDLSGVEGRMTELGSVLETLDDRLTALEERPVATGEGGSADPERSAAVTAEMEEMRRALQQQQSEIKDLLANAQSVEEATAAAAREAALQAAISKLTAALSSGEAYGPVIEDLRAEGIDDLPAGLTDNAEDGVPTLTQLQADFPDAARAGLAAARDAGLDGGEGGVAGFLRRQLDARSVQPRDGDDPDAVLSRAEAAVGEGRIAEALQEIDALPAEVTGAMEGWLEMARRRAAAKSGLQDLSQRLTAN